MPLQIVSVRRGINRDTRPGMDDNFRFMKRREYMKTEKPLVDKDYLLIKVGDKGAWTFTEIPEIPMPKTPFGMFKVKGKIDDYEFAGVHLMPLGNGNVGLPVKAEIRRKIKKQAGDVAHVTLYEDKTDLTIPDEFLLCLEMEEGVAALFESYTDSRKKG